MAHCSGIAVFRKALIYLSVFLFVLASCQTKKSVELFWDIPLSKSITGTKSTVTNGCISIAKETGQSVYRIFKCSTIPAPIPLLFYQSENVSEQLIPGVDFALKIPLYILYKSFKISVPMMFSL